MMVDEQHIKKGTTTIGIVCKDGIVLGADKRAGAGIIVDKHVKKIYKITENMAITMAGVASDAQLITKLAAAELRLLEIRKSKDASVKEAANLLSGIVYANIRKLSTIPGISHFILGGKDVHGFHLYDIFPDGSLSERAKFVSSGSGSVMAYGVLETLYKENMSLQDAVKLVVQGLNAAIQRDPNSGDGIDIVTITKDGVREYLTKEIIASVSV